MYYLKLLAISFFLYFGNLHAQTKAPAINWISWEELHVKLEKDPKKTLVFFHADWCAYCKKIDRAVFTKPEVINKINADYYAVRMNVETSDTIYFDNNKFVNTQALTKRNGVHELALLLASRTGKAFSLPVTLLFSQKFEVNKRIFEYYTSASLLNYLED